MAALAEMLVDALTCRRASRIRHEAAMPEERAAESQSNVVGSPRVHLALFGRMTANFHDREILLTNRKCRAMLGYLALTDRTEETRERLIGALWSETAEERARGSLRQALYELRAAFDPIGFEIVTTSKVTVALDRDKLSTDVWDVLRLAREGKVHPRLLDTERLTDTLLAEVETIDPAFRSWLIAKRQALHDQLVRPLARALREAVGLEKAELARALLNLDPTDEEAARTVMRLRAEAGDIGGALAAYKRLWDLLAEDFDVEPSKETQDLVAAIKLGRVGAQAAKPEGSSSHLEIEEIEGPATLAIFARGVSEEHVRALEQLMASRPDANWRPVNEEGQKAWLIEAASAAEAAKLAFRLQAACRAMPNAPRLLMGAHASTVQVSVAGGLNRSLAAIAEPGHIMASQEFRDRLIDGLDATVHDLGFVQSPGMAEPLRAFTVSPPEEPPGLLFTESARLRPAIAVLPFEVRAAQDDSATFGELLADEIITVLSGSKELDVISRLSTRSVRRQQLDLHEIWSHLQSDYVLAGSPRSGTGAELVIELTDVRSGIVRWREAREVDALDAGQARDLAEWICAAAMTAILISESERATTSPLASLRSYTLLFAAITLMDRWTRASFERSRELLVALHERAPAHPLPNAWLAAWHTRSISQGWTADRVADARAAIDFAQRSLDADPHCSVALAMDAYANIHVHRRLDIAADRLALAIEANPNDSLAWLLKGITHAFEGKGDIAIAATRRALRLSPLDPRRSYYEAMAATAELAAGEYGRAIEFANRSLRANRLHVSTLRALAVAQWLSGKHADARQTVAKLLAVAPDFRVSKYVEDHPAMDSQFGRDAADALRSAGVPL